MTLKKAVLRFFPKLIFAFLLVIGGHHSLLAQSVSLQDFYASRPIIDKKTNEIFAKLSDRQKVGQMIVVAAGSLGKPDKVVRQLIAEQKVGGVLLLKGKFDEFKKMVKSLDSLNKNHSAIPLIYSADAEPSLIHRKIEGSTPVKKSNQISSEEECAQIARTISKDLLSIGIRYNYAPVADLSPHNEAIGDRSFGSDARHAWQMTNAFVQASHAAGIVATAKHFPGHGLVKGDSHHLLPFIKGEMQEITVYEPLIDAGIISIMVGHIAITDNTRYSTDDLPASCSPKIVTDLLKNEMGFSGLVVTDAMGMGAVSKIPDSAFKAVKAGCDIILMPTDETALIEAVVAAMQKDEAFRKQVEESVKKIIRLKVCLGLIEAK